jgi:hypothetical protein
MSEDIVTLRQVAKRLGINVSTLSRAVKAGTVRRRPDGKVNLAEVVADRAKHVEAKEVAALAGDGDMTLLEARTMKEQALARLRDLEFQVKSGTLADCEEMGREVFAYFRTHRDMIQNWPARVSAVLAAECGGDQVRLEIAMEKHIRELLQYLADLPRPTYGTVGKGDPMEGEGCQELF